MMEAKTLPACPVETTLALIGDKWKVLIIRDLLTGTKRFDAVIFDLDGVLCSTDEYHYLAWKAVSDGLGVPFDRKTNDRLRGVSRMESLEIILERYPVSLSAAEKSALAEKKNELYKRYLTRLSPADLPREVSDTLDTLRGRGLKLAVGSSSKNTPFILQRLGLDGFFDAVSDGNDITHSKPDPEVFLKAAERLGVAPERCLVVEDSVAGAKAGHAGGMAVACVGDAAAAGAGDLILNGIGQLPSVLRQEEVLESGPASV